MADPALNLKVNVTGAQQGATQLDQLAKATDKTASAAQSASSNAKGAASGFQEFSKAGNDAAQIVGGLEQASAGGVRGLFGLAGAMKGLINVVRGAVGASGPFGLLALVLGTLGGLFLALRDKSKPAAEGLQSVAEKAQKAADAVKELNKQKLDALKADLEGLDRAATDATDSFSELQKQAEEVDNAREALELAKIANDSTLDDEGKARAAANVQNTFTDRSRAREVGADKFQLEQVQKRNESHQQAETEAGQDVTSSRAEIARLEAQKAADLKRNEDLFRKEGLGRAGFNRVQERFDSAKGDIEEKSTIALAAAREKLAGAEQRFLSVNEEAIRSLEVRRKAEAAYESKQKTRAEVTKLQDERQTIENDAKFGSSHAQDQERAKARQEKIDAFGKQAEDAYAKGDLAGQGEAVFQRNKLLQESKPAAPITPQKIQAFAPTGKSGNSVPEIETAAQKVSDAPAFDPQPVVDSVKKLTAAAAEKATASQGAIGTAASAISASVAQLPPALDTSELLSSFSGYHATNLQKHEQSGQKINDLARQVRLLAQQLQSVVSSR